MKQRVNVTPEQKVEYAKLMLEEGYSNQQIQDISGASESAVTRWKSQYKKELNGEMPKDRKAITPEQIRIQELEKQLRQAKKDNEILKKAAAFLIRDSNL
jgi:transposase